MKKIWFCNLSYHGWNSNISDKTVPRRESLNFFISWLNKVSSELVSSFFIFLNILISSKMDPISLPKITGCKKAAHPCHKNQRFFLHQPVVMARRWCHILSLFCDIVSSLAFLAYSQAYKCVRCSSPFRISTRHVE